MDNPQTRHPVQEFLMVNFGLLLTAAGIVLFKAPNGFAIGGISGISIIISKLTPYDLGLVMLVINAALDALGFAALGRDFGLKTVYSSFALSFFVWGGEKLVPLSAPLTGDSMLELIFAIMLPAVGSAIVFDRNSSTGGTDIIAKILTRRTHLHVGKTLLISDGVIAFSALFALGVRQGLYSILGLVLKGFLLDFVMENLNVSKKLEIVTSRPKELEQYICGVIHRDATVTDAEGAYTHEQKKVLTVVVNRRQAIALRDFVRRTDPAAFTIVTNTSEIIGKGFRNENVL
jgi:uncharacterized membrane-anchored protein YitT (DUF2179 family)